MQHLDKNMLQEKLESLDQLPSDYQPDLNSKWNLLETALDGTTEKKKKKLIVRLSVAASIALLIGFTYYIISELKYQAVPQSQISEQEESNHSSLKNTPISGPVVNSSFARKSSGNHNRNKIRKQNLILHLPSNEINASHENIIQTAAPEQIVPEVSTTEIVEEINVRPAARYVQIDFGPEDQGIREDNISVNNSQGLRVRLLPLEIELPQRLKQSSSSSMGLHTRF